MFVAVLILVIAVLSYVFLLRPVIKNAPILSDAFKAEASYMDRVRVWLLGWKTKISARVLILAGTMVGIYDNILPIAMGQDWTPVTSKLPAWLVPVGMVGVGWLFSYLHKITDNPIQVVTQKVDDGPVQVVALNKPAS